MVQLIYGTKGSGKTKRLIDMANAEMAETKGNIVFMDDDKRYMYDVKSQIRFVDVKEYNIDSAEKLYGFICGMLAQNFDIVSIYIDAFVKIVGKKAEECEKLVQKVEEIAEKNNVKAVINVSGDPNDAPEYMKKLMI